MSCAVEMKPTLAIDDDERGYEEWSEGEDIHLVLEDGRSVSGEIKEILFTEVTIISDDSGDYVTVSFEEIEGYL